MHKLVGFVIKKMDYGAEDEIVTIFSRHEVISLIALGTRKLKSKNRVALQIGNLIEIEYFRARLNNKLSKLKKATLLVQPPLRTGNTAETVLEIYSYISDVKAESELLFNSLVEVYSYFGEDFNSHIKTFILFKYLDTIGSYPKNNYCIECGRPDRINGFEFYKGGFTCVLHSAKQRDIKQLKVIKNLFEFFEDYRDTDLNINQLLQKELIKFISESTFR